jgi:L-2-hydroxyglutarate oxidase
MIRRGNRMVVESGAGEVEARLVVNCGGLHSDRLARMSGQRPGAKIVPFRGVHFTKMIGGGVECGPNAVLAFSREGYDKTSFNLFDTLETLTYPGFLRLAWKNWRAGMGELWRSLSKPAFVAALRRLVPEIKAEQLVPAPAGVRAQALMRDGRLVDDFLIVEDDLVVNVCNAPSPAATASLNIGRLIVDKIARTGRAVPAS